MAITVTHKFVSTIPDGDDTTVVRPSNWNDTHELTGLGTMAEQNANNVSITGGSISGATVSGYIPTTQKGAVNGVASLDSNGQVPLSQLPPLGELNYQGAWNATTNTPTLTSSVGTKGYYYVVSVAGTTNLNGITDWQIGDWAVYSGSVWQKVDNTDAVTSVNGQTGTVVLTYSDVGAFPATSTTGSGNVVLATGATQANPTISNYENFTPTTAPAYSEGRVWYDSSEKALAYYNDSSSIAVHVSQDLIFKVINNTGSTIPNGSPVYITGTSSGQTYPNVALAKADVAATSAVIGLTNGAIANGAIGYVSSQGTIDNVNTSTFTVGQVLYLSPYSAGQLMNTIPPTGITVQVGVATYIDSSAGHIYVKQTTPLAVPASIITGTLGVDHGGTGATTLTGYVKGSGTSALTASSTIPTTDLSGTVTNAQLANSAITINGTSTSLGGSISVGTVTSVTGTSPVVSSGGATPAISMPAATGSVDGYLTSTDWTTFNSKGSGTVTSVSGTGTVSGLTLSGTVTSSGSLTLGGTLAVAPAAVSDQSNTSTGYFDLPVGTTAQRPGSPNTGMIRYNTSTSAYEVYNGSSWVQLSTSAYSYSANYLVVAGGGNGGNFVSGGAGGLLTNTATLNPGTVYTATVGAGGGNNSTLAGTGLTTITAIGGGNSGGNGGSGGGSNNNNAAGTGTAGQGNNGGVGATDGATYNSGGGGGGAGAVGSAGSILGGGAGGAGSASSITGSSVTYAGGGGGGGDARVNTGGSNSGGTGGGGNGGRSSSSWSGQNGTVNTGGGAGGAGYNGSGFGTPGTGGSGIVILSVPTANYTGTVTGSPTVTTSGSNTIISFTSTGTYTA